MSQPAKRQKTAVAAEDDARSFQGFVRSSCTDIKSGIVRFLSSAEVEVLRNTDLWRPHFEEDNGLDLYVKERSLQAGRPFTTFGQVRLHDLYEKFQLNIENRVGYSRGEAYPLRNEGEEGLDPPHSIVEIKHSVSRLRIYVREIMKMLPDVHVHIDSHCGTSAPPGQVLPLSTKRAIVATKLVLGDRQAEWSHRVSSTAWGNRIYREIESPQMAHHPHHAYPSITGCSWISVHFISDGMVFPQYPEYYPMEHAFKLSNCLPPGWHSFDASRPEFLKGINESAELRTFHEFLAETGLYKDNQIGFRYGELMLNSNAGETRPGDLNYRFEIRFTPDKIEWIRIVMRTFPEARVHFDVHSGTDVPPSRAIDICQDAARVIMNELVRDNDWRWPERVSASSWGNRRISENDPNRHLWLWASVSISYNGVTFLANP